MKQKTERRRATELPRTGAQVKAGIEAERRTCTEAAERILGGRRSPPALVRLLLLPGATKLDGCLAPELAVIVAGTHGKPERILAKAIATGLSCSRELVTRIVMVVTSEVDCIPQSKAWSARNFTMVSPSGFT